MRDIENNKKIFLDQLKKNGIVTQACHLTKIPRSTIYRWKKDDQIFNAMVFDAQEEGTFFMSDIAESVVLKKIQEGSLPAAKFYLTHNNKKYAPKRAIDPQELISPMEQKRFFIPQLIDRKKRMTDKNEIRGIDPLISFLRKEISEYDDRTQSDIQKMKMNKLIKDYFESEE